MTERCGTSQAERLPEFKGFPDEYEFSGPWSEIMRQLGNAVPVKVAEVIASRVAGCLARAGDVSQSLESAVAS